MGQVFQDGETVADDLVRLAVPDIGDEAEEEAPKKEGKAEKASLDVKPLLAAARLR